MTSGTTSQQFCVRWNSHLGSLGAAFPQLLAGQRFVDVTLACEGHQLHCHRLVLAACSTYFESLLGENPCKHPIIILPRDIKLWEIQALVDFMYKGEVNVSQAGLSDLLKCAEILQIRGLCGADAALNLNQVNATSTQAATSSPSASSIMSTLLPSSAAISSTISTSPALSHQSQLPAEFSNTHSLPNQRSSPIQSSVSSERLENASPLNANISKSGLDSAKIANSGSGGNNAKKTYGRIENSFSLKSVKNERLHIVDQQHADNRVVDKVEPGDMSMEEEPDDPEFHQAHEKSLDGDSYSTKYVDYLEGAKGESPHHLTETQQQQQKQQQFENDGNLGKTIDETETTSKLTKLVTSVTSSRSASSVLQAKTIAVNNSASRQNHCSANHVTACGNQDSYYDEAGDIYVINDLDDDDENCQKMCTVDRRSQRRGGIQGHNSIAFAATHQDLNVNKNFRSARTNDTHVTRRYNCRGKIRVKSNDNLFDHYGTNNKAALQIDMPDSPEDVGDRMDRLVDYECTQSSTVSPPARSVRRSLPGALRFNRNSMTVFLKPARGNPNQLTYNEDYQTGNEVAEDGYGPATIKTEYDPVEENYENIVCLPNVMEMYNGNDDVNGDDFVEMNPDSDHYNVHNNFDPSAHAVDTIEYEDIKIDNEVLYAERIHTPSGILHYSNASESHPDQAGSHHFNGLEIREANRRPMEFAMAQFLSDHIAGRMDKTGQTNVPINQRSSFAANSNSRRCRYVTNNRSSTIAHNRMPVDTEPSLSAVVLRNPRSNQPRAYNNDALYAALMDVKAGESIYRASQIHKVPRKTLRNWMKRWHIKSAYPMPRQLKQAAEKKKRIQQQLEKTNVTKNPSNIVVSGRTATNNVNVFNNLNNRGGGGDGSSSSNIHSQTAAALLQSSHRQNHSISKNAHKK